MASARQQVTTTLSQFYNQPVAKVSLELFLSIAAVMFFAVFAIRPTLITMSDLVKEIEDKRALDQKLNQKLAALNTIQTTYLTLQDRLPVLDEAIPPDPDLNHVLKILERMASDRGLVITDLQVKEIPPEPDPATSFTAKERVNLPISFTVVGDYPTIRALSEDIRNSRRMLIVDSIVFAVSEERGAKKLRSTITINMPYFAAKGKKSSPGEAAPDTAEEGASK